MVPWSSGVGRSFRDWPFKIRSGVLVEMLSRLRGPGLATCWAGWTSLPGHEVHETSEADWVLAAGPRMPPVLLLVSGSMSPRQMGQGGMAGGVAAPGCVQPRSVGGASSMCPPSSSVKLTKEMFVGHAVGREKSTEVGTRKSNDER